MERADGSGGGPFEYYPVTGDAIRDAASETDAQTGLVDAIRRQLEGEHRRMLAAVEGDLEGPMREAPALAIGNMVQVAQVSQFAAGVLRLFADAVDQFNHTSTAPRSVDELNAAYGAARFDDFGLDRDRGTAWDEANAALLGILTAEYGRLEQQLDGWADHAARMLDRGPNADDVRELWALGDLGSDAYEVWPELNLVEVRLLRLPYDRRTGPDDYRTLHDLDQDELLELAHDGFEPARDLIANQVVDEFENHTALQDAWRSMNPTYLDAITSGVPEHLARLLAEIYPTTFLDVFLGAPAAGAEVLYTLTGKDLVDALREDPFSLRAVAEVAMVLPVGRIGKLKNVAHLLAEVDDIRDASSAMRGAQLKEHLRQLDQYGEDGYRVLENGRFRYYGEIDPAKKPGEMVGRRVVREWDPSTGAKRTWHETIDQSGNVRIVRPQNGPEKVHHLFDRDGNYGGRR
jgi:hypothetical protein